MLTSQSARLIGPYTLKSKSAVMKCTNKSGNRATGVALSPTTSMLSDFGTQVIRKVQFELTEASSNTILNSDVPRWSNRPLFAPSICSPSRFVLSVRFVTRPSFSFTYIGVRNQTFAASRLTCIRKQRTVRDSIIAHVSRTLHVYNKLRVSRNATRLQRGLSDAR